MPSCVVILEVMWDWRNVTTSAGYRKQAPRWFKINPDNHTGRRLHKWLDALFPDFVVTNACPQLVSSAKGRGVPDAGWLQTNLNMLAPLKCLVVCGKVAQATYNPLWAKLHASGRPQVIEIPHPAARMWDKKGFDFVQNFINCGNSVRVYKEDDEWKGQFI